MDGCCIGDVLVVLSMCTCTAKLNIMNNYPLYDVPWLVRDPNDFRMSEARHRLEVRNQAVVDEYFVLRAKGASAPEARKQVAEKYQLTPKRVYIIVHWFFNQARKRKKYDFLEKFLPLEEH